MCVYVYTLYREIHHVTSVCYRRNCIISAYYQQRETHKPTLPNVSTNLHTCPILTIRKHVISSIFTIIFSITCLTRAWEAPEKPGLDVISTDPWTDCN